VINTGYSRDSCAVRAVHVLFIGLSKLLTLNYKTHLRCTAGPSLKQHSLVDGSWRTGLTAAPLVLVRRRALGKARYNARVEPPAAASWRERAPPGPRERVVRRLHWSDWYIT